MLVAEYMILANNLWGGLLAQHGVPGIYRSQQAGRVRMSTQALPHEAIGVPQYAWSTSPLRRYVDLVNQRQLVARVRGEPPPYAGNDAELFAVVSGFDAAYSAYAEFQQRMERYWALRWIRQERLDRLGAVVLKDDLLRIEGMPFVTRLPALPELPRGQRLELDILATHELELSLEARVHRVLSAQTEIDLEDEADAANGSGISADAAGASAAESAPPAPA
jgi:exoribonuclease-2